ncbi:MAG: type II toxin-antitoxin system RelE family toxin [Nitrospiraceae bacterium]
MKHFASPEFWQSYHALPKSTQELADKNFSLLKADPRHPSLHLKKVGRFWSVRVGLGYRALGVDVAEGILWFWIGSHADYDKLTGR